MIHVAICLKITGDGDGRFLYAGWLGSLDSEEIELAPFGLDISLESSPGLIHIHKDSGRKGKAFTGCLFRDHSFVRQVPSNYDSCIY